MSTTTNSSVILDLLVRAEASLAMVAPTWRTDQLVNLDIPCRAISPSMLPSNGQHAYGVLWKYMDIPDATETLKYIVNEVLEDRHWETYEGVCPTCGELGTVTDYDWGEYTRVVHNLEDEVEGRGYARRRCYSGPNPLPETYEG